MTLQNQIKEDMKVAMKAREMEKTTTLRSLMSAFTNELVANGKTPQDEIDDATALSVIKRAVKQRKDAIEQFEKGGRPELATAEKAELDVLEKYLPEQMSEEQVRNIVIEQKETLGITDRSKMGVLIGAVMKETGGNADGQMVKQVVDQSFDESA